MMLSRKRSHMAVKSDKKNIKHFEYNFHSRTFFVPSVTIFVRFGKNFVREHFLVHMVRFLFDLELLLMFPRQEQHKQQHSFF